MLTLTLALKGEYFDAIMAGVKQEEYRLVTPYWRKRLEGRIYDAVVLTKGYPKRDDLARRLTLPWQGYRETTITHAHFGEEPVAVFASSVQLPSKPVADWSTAPEDASHVLLTPGSRVCWLKLGAPREVAYWRWPERKVWRRGVDDSDKWLGHMHVEARPTERTVMAGR